MKRRVLSIIMCLCMIMTLVPFSALAAPAEGNVTNGYYDETGAWQAGGDGTKSYTAEDGTKLTLGKTAEDKGNNTYEITLQVKAERSEEITPPGAAATVLVIDVSGSMKWCANCGESSHSSSCPYHKSGWGADNSVTTAQRRMTAAKTAAINFLDSYKGDAAGSGRYVAIVKFSDDASVVLDWVDVSTITGYNSAVSKINGLSPDGGTNLDDGLYTANSQFSKNAVKSVDKAQHYVVALTDGAPTYYRNGGNGKSGSSTINSATAATATTLRSNSTVYTVCFGVADDYTWEEGGFFSGTTYGPTVGNFLSSSIATSGCAYNAGNATELYAAFAEISKSISSGIGSSGEGAHVTDPMGMFVSATTVPANFFAEDSGYKWNLETVTPVKSTNGGVTTYTYSYILKYTVTIDADAEGFDETVFHPANQPTTLTWPTGETFEFPVPGIKGETSRFTATYLKGDHGVLNGGDASVKYENIKKWSDTVTSDRPTPDVTADDGYYFVGWEPVIADKVTGNAVYVAQYAAQTEVVITGDSNTVDYNGTEQSVTTYQVAGVDAAALSGISYVAKGTDAGTYAGKFSGTPVITIDGKDVTGQYKFTYKTGELVVNKLDVVLKSGSDSKVYDGQPLTNKTVEATGFVEGEGASYSDFASITQKGEKDNTFSYTLNDNTKASNYNIKVEYGKLSITPVTDTIKVIAGSDEKVYDGTPLTKDSYKVEGVLADGDELVAVVSGTITDVGDTANVITSYKVMHGDKDVTANYANIVTVDGKLVVTQREVVLTSGSASKTYDGKALTCEEVEVGGMGFVRGEGASYSDFASITNAGTTDNTFEYTLNANTKAENYKITVVNGELTVSQVETKITVTADDASKTYDGKPLEKDGYSFEGKLAEGDKLVVVVEGSRTDAGESANVVKEVKVVNAAGEDVTANYKNIETVDGKLVVSQREVVLTSGSDSKIYDGQPLTKEEVSVGGDGFASGEGASYSNFASITDVGSTDNTFDYTLNDNTKAENYKITVVNGKLEVEAMGGVIVTVKENSGEYTYDGTEKTVEGYVVKSISDPLYTAEDFTFSGSAVVKGTDVGTYDMAVVPADFANTNPNFKDVTFVVEDGQLVINPLEGVVVTVKENSGEYTYDGTEKTVEGYTVSISDPLYTEADFSFKGSAVVKGTDVGIYDMEVLPADFVNTNPNFKNVTFVVEDGQLVIKPLEGVVVTVKENSGEYTYDGTEKTVEGYVVKEINNPLYTAEDFAFSGSAVVKGTDVGTYDMEVLPADFANTNPNFKDVTFIVEDGQLVINPLEGVVVTVKENSGEYTYDGTEKTVEGYVVKEINNPLYTAEDFAFSGSAVVKGTDVGTYDMAVVPADFANTNPNFKDVTFIVEDGQLVINPLEGVVVTVKENSGEYTYDGTEKTVEGYTVKNISDPLYTEADFTFSGSAVVKGTDVGTYDMEVVSADFANTNPNFKDVSFVVEDGQLTITPVTDTVKVIAGSDEKVYDGTPLTKDSYKVEGVLADGDELVAVVSGTITDVGDTANVITSYKVMHGDKDVTANYANIVTVDGKLVVTQREVVLTSGSASKTYDGKALTCEEVEVGGMGFVRGEGASYSDFASITNAGTTDNTFEYTLNANTKAENYKITVVNGELTVSQVETKITVTADDASKTYDGKPLEADGYSFEGKLAEGDKLVVVVEGSQTDAGESANVVKEVKVVNAAGEDVTANYKNIETVDGKLVVSQREVVLTSGSDSKTYDGQPLTKGEVSVGGDGFAEGEGASYSNFASITDVGSTDNTFEYALNDNTKAENYKITVVNGKLEVEAMGGVIVTVKENSGEYTYDGTEKTVEGYAVKSISDPLYTEADFTFNGSAVVKGTDVGTYDMAVVSADFANTNPNFKDVTFVVEDGQLVITPLEGVVVTVKENSGEYTYDGTEKTVEGYVVKSISDPLYTEADFSFKGSAVVKGTVVGTYDMEVLPADFANTNPNFKNVTFVVEDGQLVIKPVSTEIVIKANDASKIYDGTALTDAGFSYTQGVLAEGDVLTAVVEGRQVDAGSGANVVTSYKVMRGDIDVTNCYTFGESVDGLLQVSKRPVTLTSGTDSKTYDGTPLTKEEVTVGGMGFVSGEGASYSAFASITDKGSVDNTFRYALNDNTKAENYDITVINGKLTIAPVGRVIVTITENSGEYVYDGTEKTVEGYTVSISDPLYTEEDFTFSGSAVVKGTYVGAYDMELVPENFSNTNENFANVEFVIVDGQLTIIPVAAEITIKANDAEKVYDGTALTENGYTVTEGILLEGDELVVVIEGSQLNAGSSANAVESYKVMRGDVDVTDCYTFAECQNGTLTVTPKSVVITSGSASKEYDGKALTCDKVTAEGFIDGEGAEFNVTGSQTEVGSSKNTFEYTLNENTLAENYNITVVEGTLTVTPEKAPKTGDDTNNALWIGLMAASAAGTVGIAVLRKKEDGEA